MNSIMDQLITYKWIILTFKYGRLTEDCVFNDDTSMGWLVFRIVLGTPSIAFTLYCIENVDLMGCTV